MRVYSILLSLTHVNRLKYRLGFIRSHEFQRVAKQSEYCLGFAPIHIHIYLYTEEPTNPSRCTNNIFMCVTDYIKCICIGANQIFVTRVEAIYRDWPRFRNISTGEAVASVLAKFWVPKRKTFVTKCGYSTQTRAPNRPSYLGP